MILIVTLFVAVLVCLPLLNELILTFAEILGFRRIRINPVVLAVSTCLDRAQKRAEKATVLLVYAFIFLPIYVHINEILPMYRRDPDFSAFDLIFFHVLPSLWLNGNNLFHFTNAVRSDPGYPPSRELVDSDKELSRTFGAYKTCRKCNLIKPPQTHHCSTCEVWPSADFGLQLLF